MCAISTAPKNWLCFQSALGIKRINERVSPPVQENDETTSPFLEDGPQCLSVLLFLLALPCTRKSSCFASSRNVPLAKGLCPVDPLNRQTFVWRASSFRLSFLFLWNFYTLASIALTPPLQSFAVYQPYRLVHFLFGVDAKDETDTIGYTVQVGRAVRHPTDSTRPCDVLHSYDLLGIPETPIRIVDDHTCSLIVIDQLIMLIHGDALQGEIGPRLKRSPEHLESIKYGRYT